MAIAFYAEDIKLPAIKKRAVGNWVKEVAATYGKKVGDISYIFCSDEKILEVNRQYLQHDYYTDIITFDYTSGDKISGDLFISLDTVRLIPKLSTPPTMRSSTVPSFTVSSTSAASTTKAPENARSWRLTRIKHWQYCRRNAGKYKNTCRISKRKCQNYPVSALDTVTRGFDTFSCFENT